MLIDVEEEEQWKLIDGFNNYNISNQGRAKI